MIVSACVERKGNALPASASTEEAAVDLLAAFSTACAVSGLSHKAVAFLMGVTREYLYQMLRQQRPLSLVRLLKMRDDPDGRKFLRAYWPLVGEAMGIPEFSQGMRIADALMVFIDNHQKHMAKAQIAVREVEDEAKSA